MGYHRQCTALGKPIVDFVGPEVARELLRAGQAKPRAVGGGEAAQGQGVVGEVVLDKAPGVASALGRQAKGHDAEEGVQNLGVDLYPYAARRVDVVASRVAHGGRGVAEQQEDHAAPRHNVETVDYDDDFDQRHVAQPGGRRLHHGRWWSSRGRWSAGLNYGWL
ncbi:hypothetical protein HYQ46_007815 [Verticillium longisporum]|nr:hypothetical protein HYQ46_007815 [Verticillium longisporum]